jgi:hypothetical protein
VRTELAGWRALDAANRHRAATIARALDTLEEIIGDRDFIVLKGVDYGNRLYPSPELRPSADIDILVRRERIPDVIARLQSRGFNRRYTRYVHFSNRCPDLAFSLAAVTLEVHHSIVQRSRVRIDYDTIWRERVPFKAGRLDAWRLSDVHGLLTAVINVAKEDLATPLGRYLDIWLMLRKTPHLYGAAFVHSRQWRIANSYDAVMRIIATMFPELELPLRRRPLLDRLVATPAAAMRRNRQDIGRAGQLWRKFWLIDGFDQRLLFALDIAAAKAYGLTRRRELSA